MLDSKIAKKIFGHKREEGEGTGDDGKMRSFTIYSSHQILR